MPGGNAGEKPPGEAAKGRENPGRDPEREAPESRENRGRTQERMKDGRGNHPISIYHLKSNV